jgi:hypothetical protein
VLFVQLLQDLNTLLVGLSVQLIFAEDAGESVLLQGCKLVDLRSWLVLAILNLLYVRIGSLLLLNLVFSDRRLRILNILDHQFFDIHHCGVAEVLAHPRVHFRRHNH